MKKWIFVYFILAFSVLYLAAIFSKQNMPTSYVVIPGTVVDASTHLSEGRTLYAEVISFELNQQEHRFTRNLSSTIRPQIGRTRQLIVNSKNPFDVHVRTWTWLEKITPKSLRHNPNIIYLWLIGCAFFAVGWFCSMSYYEFFRRAIIVPGEVTSRTNEGGMYGAIVSYVIDGKVETVTSNFRSNKKPIIGTKCKVGLNPDNMQIARIREGLWFFLIFAGVGLALWGAVFVISMNG